MKYYVIADLHGRYDLLEKALVKINEVASIPYKIVTLGDYIDRGKKSRQIIQRLMEEQEKRPDVFVCLKGNHEDMMYETIRKPLSLDWWLGNGGDATLKSYGADFDGSGSYYPQFGFDTRKVSHDHLNWIRDLPLYYETPKHVFVHAGVIDDGRPLSQQKPDVLLWMLYHAYEKGGYRGKHVVHGHHQFADGPHVWAGRTDLDTFAYKTGRLVIGVFDDTQGQAKEFIEVYDV